MKARLLTALFVLISLVVGNVLAAVCQGVVECEKSYLSNADTHDKEIFCREVSGLIKCVQTQQCLGDTADHKIRVLRQFQNDSSCSDGHRLTPKYFIFIFTAFAISVWKYKYL